MAKKAKGFGVDNYVLRKRKKRKGRHAKSPNKNFTKKKSRGQGRA
ncbi:hypothetical protein [uncultured Mediterranean phage uvMED]|jgi:hypothetical protein|nr:hypothetical protein [uncultured Mediterranean phage uvMED]|tara:strand:- start:1880 stop:2014 length:135 start_codon:yes stop_codon:yes gene_type:complete